MIRFIISLIFCLFIIKLSACEQVDDILIIGNDTISIPSPLSGANEKFQKIWDKKIDPFPYINTGCYRGAICTWQIENDSIFLIKIVSCIDNKIILLSKLGMGKNKIYANWLSTTITFTNGEKLCDNIFESRWRISGTSIYEYFNAYQIDCGKIVKKEIYDNTYTKCGNYKTWQELYDEIEKDLTLNAIWGTNVNVDLKFIINSDGRPQNISIDGTQDTSICSRIIQTINSIEGLPLYYEMGKPIIYNFEGSFKIDR